MTRRAVFTLGLLAWCAVVLAAYYAVHKPLPADLNRAGAVWGLLGQGVSWRPALATLGDLAAACWITVVAAGCGSGVLRRTRLTCEPLARWVFGTALGFGCIALVVFLLAAVQFLTPVWLLFAMGLLTGVAAMGFRRVTSPVSELPSPPGRGAGGEGGLPVRFLQLGLCLTFAMLLTQALAPPTGWDSLVYHLTAPWHYLALGGYQPGLDIPHAYFPSLVEQLFTVGLVAGSDSVPTLLHLAIAATGVAGVFSFVRRRSGSAAAWFAVTVLMTVTSLATLATRSYVDWGVVTFGFLSFWALEVAGERGSRGWLVVSAVLAGMAIGSKYTAVFVVAGVGWLLLWRVLRCPGVSAMTHRLTDAPRRLFPRWPNLAWWCAIAALVYTPWLLRDWALTGNPVYPFVFGGWQWDAWKTAWITRPGTGLLAEPIRVLAAPWEVTVLGREGGMYDATVGPLLLGLLPVAAIAARATGWVRRALVVAGFGYGGWLVGAAGSSLLMQGRLLLPVAPFLAVAIAAGWARLPALDLPWLRASRLMAMVTGLAAAVALLTLALGWVANPPLPVLLGAESRDAYTARRLGEYAAAVTFVDTQLPSTARTLFLWEPRTYLCHRPNACQADALLFNWRHLLYEDADNPDRVAATVRGAGYTHLLVYGGGLRFFTEPPDVETEPQHVEALLNLLTRHGRLLYGPPLADTLSKPAALVAGGGYAVYELR